MPVVESRCRVPVDPAMAFAVSQTTGEVRLRWDPFIRRQWFVGGATAPATGVRSVTQHRFGWRMMSEYVSYRPPTNVGMKMVRGPRFFASFAGGWQFRAVDVAEVADGEPSAADTKPVTEAVWRYSFRCRPKWLAPLAERIGVFVLQPDIDRRLAGFAKGCQDPVVLAAAGAALDDSTRPSDRRVGDRAASDSEDGDRNRDRAGDPEVDAR